MPHQQTLDLLGIGIGPANLSVAALLHPLDNVTSSFCEKKPQFEWHPGLMFPEANIQVSFLKDLVTLADPTNVFSFVSFLHTQKRLYRFITANFSRISRMEYSQYLRWVCDSLPNLKFGCPIEEIRHDGSAFTVHYGNGSRRARNLVLGTGLSPMIPECARKHLGHSTLLMGLEYLDRNIDFTGLRVAVIGGGQSGAEIVARLIHDISELPKEVMWVSRRSNLFPLDESPFANELFTPAYSAYFHRLMPKQKARLLAEQKMASEGIAMDLLERVYRQLYALEFLHNRGQVCSLKLGCQLEGMERCGGEWLLTLDDRMEDQRETVVADMVILCTGFEYRMPEYLEPLSDRIHWKEDGYCVGSDFSIEWDGPPDQKIYVQNAARKQRGIADPNLSLMAWRGAMIINSMLQTNVYDVEQSDSLLHGNAVCGKTQGVGGRL